jgi:hypothetical protein
MYSRFFPFERLKMFCYHFFDFFQFFDNGGRALKLLDGVKERPRLASPTPVFSPSSHSALAAFSSGAANRVHSYQTDSYFAWIGPQPPPRG